MGALSLHTLSFRLFGAPAARLVKAMPGFKDRIVASNICIFPETYFALMLFAIFATFPLLGAGVILILSRDVLGLPFLLMPSIEVILFFLAPSMFASSRASSVEQELPYAATYMTTMVRGGMSMALTLKRLEKNVWLPSTAKEARTILTFVEIFALDPLTAIERLVNSHPSRAFADFLSGYLSIVRGGGDLVHYLEVKTKELFEIRSTNMKMGSERLAFFMETYVILGVIMTLGFYTLFSADSVYNTGMASASTFSLVAFVLLPAISMIFIAMAHSMQMKTPLSTSKPYYMFLASLPIGVMVVYAIYAVLGQSLFLALSLGLLLVSVPPTIAHRAATRHLKGVEVAMANFLRVVAESRKTGLSPENCIAQSAKRKYGPLTREIELVASQISWGIPIRKVYESFAKRVKSWFALINMYLLVEAIEFGGGTVPTIESLATFCQISSDVERELRMRMRPFILMPYLGAMLLVFSTLGIMMFTTNTVASTSTVESAGPSMGTFGPLFASAIMLHSWMMGMVGGKISGGTVSSGFKHGLALVVLAFLSATLFTEFMGVSL